jgi:hypothetical protein
MQQGWRRLFVAISIRRGFFNLHIHEVGVARDEFMEEGFRREGYHLRAPDLRGITQSDRIMKKKKSEH